MSTSSRSTSRLFVEGTHDRAVICAVLEKHFTNQPRWFRKDLIEEGPNDERALSNFVLATKNPGRWGLVLDADVTVGKGLGERWDAIRTQLRREMREAETFPSAPPAEGWVTHLRQARVGVWLMPDNVNAGALEAFLLGLVPPSPLFDHAGKAVSEAITHGAKFADVHREKARLHTYLAWSKEPGRPYGRAIAAGDFDVTRSELPTRFAAWVERLFG